jgi:hypothetical protein
VVAFFRSTPSDGWRITIPVAQWKKPIRIDACLQFVLVAGAHVFKKP